MMMTFQEFKEKWKNIPEFTNGYLSLGIKHPLDFHIGYYSSDSKSLVIMDTEKISNIPSSYAVSARNVKLSDGIWILEFQLLQNSFEDVFLRLCWDMIDYSENSKETLKELIARYMSWQKFLQYRKKSILSFQRQKGLLGELLYFQEHLSKGKEDIVSSWVGPDGSDQDFIFGDFWAEIKAVKMSAEVVGISSLQQLDQTTVGKLEAYFLEQTTPGNNRIILPMIVKTLRTTFNEQPLLLDRFNIKLYKYGYDDADIEEYKKNIFRLTEHRTYIVDDDFPKLVRNNVNHGIANCSYTLSLNALEKHRER